VGGVGGGRKIFSLFPVPFFGGLGWENIIQNGLTGTAYVVVNLH